MTNENNTNTSASNGENLIPSEVLASGKQISFPDFNFYKIRTFCGKYIDIRGGSMDDLAYALQYTGHNADNQKFLIFTLDNNYSVIAAKHSGKVMDIWDTPNFPPGLPDILTQYYFKNGDNQKFFIANDGSVAVKQDGRVLDVHDGRTSNDVPIIAYNYQGSANQKFNLEKSGTVSIKPPTTGTLPPAPDFKTTNLDEELPDDTTPVITHATYLPYFMVKDPYYNAQQKITNSPYYILVRRQYWEKKTQRVLAPSETYDYMETTGVSRTDQTSMTETTEISIGADLGFMFKGFSLGLSTSITKSLSVTKSTSNTESTEISKRVVYTNPFKYQIAYAKYMLINEYYVTRSNGEMITSGDASYWKVPDPERTVSRIIPRR
ncbi:MULTISPECIES: RICIN domain-containing protein [Bacillus cereus group]|uniref:RICIN domain-containing protein n=1 Tax=Bacillus cereus group TaxID=86661 RepID=UPI0009AAF71B|nr:MULTISPECIES: RICIN domain-containing protein [Bacillus cereus group]PGU51711.1 insecticidal toxin [Bacillus cereus]